MYLFFLDGSGDPQIPHAGASSHFILGGLAIPDFCWPDAANHLKTVKDYYGVSGFPEIKWRHIHQPYDPKGVPDNKQPIVNMEPERRTRLAKGVLEVVQKRQLLVVFATVVDKTSLLRREIMRRLARKGHPLARIIAEGLCSTKVSAKKPGPRKAEIATLIGELTASEVGVAEASILSEWLVDSFHNYVFEIAFADVIGNLESFLMKAPALPSRQGLVIQDEQEGEERNRYARACFQRRTEADERPINERPLLECLSLVPSHHSVGVQLADFCMGALNSFVTRGNKIFYDVIDENVNKARRGGKTIGLHHLPK